MDEESLYCGKGGTLDVLQLWVQGLQIKQGDCLLAI